MDEHSYAFIMDEHPLIVDLTPNSNDNAAADVNGKCASKEENSSVAEEGMEIDFSDERREYVEDDNINSSAEINITIEKAVRIGESANGVNLPIMSAQSVVKDDVGSVSMDEALSV
jgi:hypothetical protein